MPDASAKTIAVAIPCYNEAAAIAEVVARWREALPGAEVVVFDNASDDGTGAIARGLGVRVVDVPEQGKGHAVRAIFEGLADSRRGHPGRRRRDVSRRDGGEPCWGRCWKARPT